MRGNICVITSVVPGNGAKWVATSLASSMIDEKEENKVLLIDFDFENPFLASPYVKHDEIHGIDNLVTHISDNDVSNEIFLENVITTNFGADVLKGTNFIEKAKRFSKEHIEVILNKAKLLYDYVYVVVNAKANSAGTVYSLANADKILLVLRNNHANERKIDLVLKLIEQYKKSTASLYAIYNYKNLNTDVQINFVSINESVKVLGALNYDEKDIDNLGLDKKKSLFGSSSNKGELRKANRQLWE